MTTTAAEVTRLSSEVNKLQGCHCDNTAALARTTQDVKQLLQINTLNDAEISRLFSLALSDHTLERLTPQLEKALKEIESLKACLVVAEAFLLDNAKVQKILSNAMG